MLSIAEAQQLVLQHARRTAAQPLPLAESLGQVLAEPIVSDIDMPPFDKSLVDGLAVRVADLPGGTGTLRVVDKVFAGQVPRHTVEPGTAVQLMTGAPIPAGADAVVMIERTQPTPAGMRVHDERLRIAQNIVRRATELTQGQVVLQAGVLLRPAEIGVLAQVGRAQVRVFRRPRIAVLSTGDELVDCGHVPGPGQIRNSNGPTIAALIERAGAEPLRLGIARDVRDVLRACVAPGLDADMLVLSGGVSAGELDLVPGVLRELGVREVFHRVQLKPGKPVWFGVHDRAASSPSALADIATTSEGATDRTLVFGLPGNPVSVMVCFELFVRPAIRYLRGELCCAPCVVRAALLEPRRVKSDRPTYWPAQLDDSGSTRTVQPVSWHGSPDLHATTAADCFVVFPPGEYELQKGDTVDVLVP
jgi:molybdopterin molybdotransferase